MAALALSTFPSTLVGQDPGRIQGLVTSADSSRGPVTGAAIYLDGHRQSVRTDRRGKFVLAAVPVGTHAVEARMVGFTPAVESVTVAAGETTIVNFELTSLPVDLGAVTVIGSSRDIERARRDIADVPGGVSFIGSAELEATRQANLKDVLGLTAGVFVQPRHGSADESQISIRGSGLRGNFHARGVNLLVNGMPYRNADGFSDFESLELLTAEAIEVYKGANAFRFGGSTLGGAVNLLTKTGFTATPLSLVVRGGGFGFAKAQVESGKQLGNVDYYASVAETRDGGYRDWSEQRRDRVNLHLGYRSGLTTDARMFYFYARVDEQLPGSLTAGELQSTPAIADSGNRANRWGRIYDLHHLGLQLRARLSPRQELELNPYLQYRDIDHPIYQVINQQSYDWGAEVRYRNSLQIGGRGNELIIGFQPAYQTMENRQFENLEGKHGDLTRDERDRVVNLAWYLENVLTISRRFDAILGLRYERSRRTVADRFLADGDQSDRLTYASLNPRLGLMYRPSGLSRLFINVSKTTEPPLLLEMTSFGNPGGFIPLSSQRAWQIEVGARGTKSRSTWDISLYDIELRNEILNANVQPYPGAPFTVPTYRNAKRTRHYGFEGGATTTLASGLSDHTEGGGTLSLRLAYTYGRFKYRADSLYRDNDIPGIPAHHLRAELSYLHSAGFRLQPSLELVPADYYVNSYNTARNQAWAALSVRAEWFSAPLGLTGFVEGRNLTGRRYSASVQVDNAVGRYFEPSDGRTLNAGFRWIVR